MFSSNSAGELVMREDLWAKISSRAHGPTGARGARA